jgi:hypothetical protein
MTYEIADCNNKNYFEFGDLKKISYKFFFQYGD